MTDIQAHTKKSSRWWDKKDVRQTAILTVVLTPIIGYLASEVQVRLMGPPASQVMKTTENLMYIFTWAAAPVMAIVFAIAIVSLSGKLHYGDNPPPEADHAIRNSSKTNIVWVTLSAILCLFAVVGGMVVLQHDNESILDDAAVDINVTGQQWVWNYDYPDTEGVRSQELHLVVNKPVVFHVTAIDVKHSFWIVEMGVKVDANPGAITEVAVNPNKLGVFNVRCAELCGLLHSYMQNKVYVQTQADYDKWLSTQPRRDYPGNPFPQENGDMKTQDATEQKGGNA